MSKTDFYFNLLGIQPDEVGKYAALFDAWRDHMGSPRHGADGREIRYDEWVEAYPVGLTDEDLTANHAAGLPIRREHIVRCRNCAYFFRDATPHDEDCPHFCSRHGTDMSEDDGFCSWGRKSE